MKECHAAGCTRQVRSNVLMCGKHWRMVPRHVKRRYLAAVRAYDRDSDSLSKGDTFFLWLGRTIASVAEAEGVATSKLPEWFEYCARQSSIRAGQPPLEAVGL